MDLGGLYVDAVSFYEREHDIPIEDKVYEELMDDLVALDSKDSWNEVEKNRVFVIVVILTMFGKELSTNIDWTDRIKTMYEEQLNTLSIGVASEQLTEDGFTYYIKNEEAYIIGAPFDKGTKFIVPDTLGGYPVVEIIFYMVPLQGYDSIRLSKNIKYFDGASFSETISSIEVDDENETFAVKDDVLYSKDLKTLVCFPPTKSDFDISCLHDVEIIGAGAFCCCDSIKRIRIPDSVKEIHDFAFARSESLEEIYIPDSVAILGSAVFAYCVNLKNVRLSKNTKVLRPDITFDAEGEGFFQCSAIRSITLPDGVEVIGHFAFYGCDQLKEVYIPKSVKTIIHTAFAECNNLSSIVVDEESENFYTSDRGLYDKNNILILEYKK